MVRRARSSLPSAPRRAPAPALATLCLLLTGAALPGVAAADEEGGGGALPWETWFRRPELLYQERPAVSPDGRWVAYTVVTPRPEDPRDARYLDTGTPGPMVGARITVADTATGTAHDPCPDGGNCWRPAWSPDGRRLALFADAGGAPQLWVYDVVEERVRRVTDAVLKPKIWAGDEARWSPDGRRLFVALAPEAVPEAAPAEAPVPSEDGGGGPTVTVRRSGAEAEAVAGEPPPDPLTGFLRRENAARLAAVEVASGEVRVLAPADAEPTPAVLRLSPSGRWVSYLSIFHQGGAGVQDTTMDLAAVPAGAGAVHTLARGLPVQDLDYFGSNYRWHPREDRLVYLQGDRLWAVDLRGDVPSEPRALTADEPDGPGPLAPSPLLFTADGSAVVVGLAGEGDEVVALARVPLEPARAGEGGTPPLLPVDTERVSLLDVLSIDGRTAWAPEPGTVTLLAEDVATGERIAVRARPGTGERRELWRRVGRLESVAGPAGSLVGVYQDASTPPDVYRLSADLAVGERISTVAPGLDAVRGVEVEMLETLVPTSGGTVERARTAVLLPAGTPPGARLPAVVALYPGAQVSRAASRFAGGDFTTLPNLLFTSRGYAVVLPDLPLGPEGEPGRPVREMVDALLPQLYHAAEEGWIDLRRLGVLGQSYGGYGAAAIVSRTGLFRAAVAISGIYDLPGSWGRLSRFGTNFFRDWAEGGQARMGSHPWAELPRYLESSPYYQADDIATPLLLLHGTEDDAVDDARKLFTALERLERTAQYAEYEGEGHVVDRWRLVNAADAARRAVEFFGRYLGEPAAETPVPWTPPGSPATLPSDARQGRPP